MREAADSVPPGDTRGSRKGCPLGTFNDKADRRPDDPSSLDDDDNSEDEIESEAEKG